jgi:hypothetical protein
LNDNDQLKFYKNCLYNVSKVPLTRFDAESGETWFGSDPTSVARTEIDFARYVNRLRNQFAQIVLKPLKLQLALAIPELQDNREFLEAISLQYKSYNLFEEMMEMELMQKRVEFIQTMKESMVDMDVEGNEIKYFSSKFLVQRYLKFSSEDLKLNKKLKEQEIEELNLAGGDNESDEEMGGTSGSAGFGSFGESIDYDKLANMIVEKLSNNKTMVTEVDDKEKACEDLSKKSTKTKKKGKKKDEEE